MADAYRHSKEMEAKRAATAAAFQQLVMRQLAKLLPEGHKATLDGPANKITVSGSDEESRASSGGSATDDRVYMTTKWQDDFKRSVAEKDDAAAAQAVRQMVTFVLDGVNRCVVKDDDSGPPKDRLLLKLRKPSYYQLLQEQVQVARQPPEVVAMAVDVPHVRVGNAPFFVELCEDSETSTAVVGGKSVRKWGVPFDQLVTMALDNLRALKRGTVEEWTAHMSLAGPGVYISSWTDSYDAPTLLLSDELRAWAKSVGIKGAPVAVPVADHVLVVSGTEEPAGLAQIPDIIKHFARGRWLCGKAIVLADRPTPSTAARTGVAEPVEAASSGAGAGGAGAGTAAATTHTDEGATAAEPSSHAGTDLAALLSAWSLFVPPSDSPIASSLRLGALLSDSGAYMAQKRFMSHEYRAEHWARASGFGGADDLFVAKFNVLGERLQDGGTAVFSCATLSQGVNTLLPKVDRVALVVTRPPGPDFDGSPEALMALATPVGMVEWDKFVAALPEGLRPLLREDGEPVLPLRYVFKDEFPDVSKLGLADEDGTVSS